MPRKCTDIGQVKTEAVCSVEDTLDVKNLMGNGCNGVGDPCLEHNYSIPIDINKLNIVPGTEVTVENSTWYSAESQEVVFQWQPGFGTEILFDTYDYVVALDDELREKFPPGSILIATFNGTSIPVKVIDRKAANGADFGKIVVYKFGGYELLQQGRFKTELALATPKDCKISPEKFGEFVKNNPKTHPLSACFKDNSYLLIQRGLYRPENGTTLTPNDYINSISAYMRLAKDSLYRGFIIHLPLARPHLVLTHHYIPRGKDVPPDEVVFIEMRIGPFTNEEESTYLWDTLSLREYLSPFPNNLPWRNGNQRPTP